MSSLPRVAEHTRERVSKEFDSLGPEVCLAEVSQELKTNNPELLDMAQKCARDVGDPARIMIGFGMFYRLLIAQCRTAHVQLAEVAGALQLNPLPRVTPDTRDAVARRIDEKGAEAFTMQSMEALERSNPQLLQMAHNFASRHEDYLGVMQGFALLYEALVAQSIVDRASLH